LRSAITNLRAPGRAFLLTFGILVAGIVAAVGVATRISRGRASAAVAEQQLRRVPSIADLVSNARASGSQLDDSVARAIASTAGVSVVLLDPDSAGAPRILASSLPRDARLTDIIRESMTASAPDAPVLVPDHGGDAVYVASFLLPRRDGTIAARLVAIAEARSPAFDGGIIDGTAAVAAILALGLAALAERRWNVRALPTPSEPPSAAAIAGGRQSAALSDHELADVTVTRVPTAYRASVGMYLDESELSPGEVFADRYEIIELLGRSDVRTAYKVRDRERDELVLLKTLAPGAFGGDSAGVAQFRADLRIVRRLAHRNILRTYDFGESTVYYVTMELVDATPIHDLLKSEGRLSVDATVSIGTQASRALAVAHREGVLHRDLRPRSLLLDTAGLLTVADFGLATTAQRIRALAHTSDNPNIVAYVPPEVLRADVIDARSDLYSLAVVLYQCASGRLPVTVATDSGADSIQALSSIDPGIPQWFSDVVGQTLSSRPDRRPPDAETFRQMLTREPSSAVH
jgi:hypothetical protein